MGSIDFIAPREGGLPNALPTPERAPVLPAYAPYEPAAKATEQIGQEAEQGALTYAQYAGKAEAVQKTSEFNQRADTLYNEMRNAPPRTEQIDDGNGGFVTKVIPKSSYFMQEFDQKLNAMKQAYLDSSSPIARRTLQTDYFLSIDKSQRIQHNVAESYVENTLKRKEVFANGLQVQSQEQSSMGNPSLVPMVDPSQGPGTRGGTSGDMWYQAAKQRVEEGWKPIAQFDPQLAENMKQRAFYELAHARLSGIEQQNPEAFLKAYQDDPNMNGWADELKDPAALAQLAERARASVKRMSGQNTIDHNLAREATKDDLVARLMGLQGDQPLRVDENGRSIQQGGTQDSFDRWQKDLQAAVAQDARRIREGKQFIPTTDQVLTGADAAALRAMAGRRTASLQTPEAVLRKYQIDMGTPGLQKETMFKMLNDPEVSDADRKWLYSEGMGQIRFDSSQRATEFRQNQTDYVNALRTISSAIPKNNLQGAMDDSKKIEGQAILDLQAAMRSPEFRKKFPGGAQDWAYQNIQKYRDLALGSQRLSIQKEIALSPHHFQSFEDYTAFYQGKTKEQLRADPQYLVESNLWHRVLDAQQYLKSHQEQGQ